MGKNSAILALDIGTTFGWAFAVDGAIIKSGSVNLGNYDGHKGLVYTRFYNWLQDWVGLVDYVAYELVMEHAHFCPRRKRRVANTIAAQTYGGMLAMVQMLIYLSRPRITAVPVHVATLKKEFTGSGKAKKIDICARAHHLGWLGGEVGTDKAHDEADAFALAHITLERLRNGML